MVPRICLIGHTDYSLKLRSSELTLPFGEVNNARKLQQVLKKNGVPVTEIFDLYELFEIESMSDERGQLFLEMIQVNATLGESGLDFITDFNNSLAATFHRNLAKAIGDYDQNVILFLSWPGRTVSALCTGLQKKFPIIVKESSYIRAENIIHPFPMKLFSKEVNVIVSESLLGAINCCDYGIPLDKFLFLPNLAPPEAGVYADRSDKQKKESRNRYLHELAAENQKKIKIDENTLLIGCPYRFVRRKNVDMLIEAVSELYREHPNILLVLKGDMDSEFDVFSQYSEKLYQLLQSANEQPWFLWDRSLTSYPEVLEQFSCYDICPLLSGAELGSNTVVEVCSLGVPVLVLDASVNPYLYNDMAQFVQAGEICNSSWIYLQPDYEDLKDQLRDLILSPEKRKELGTRGRKLAHERFGEHQLLERIPLAAKAAWSFFHEDAEAPHYRKLLVDKLIADFAYYGVKHPQ